MSEIAKTQGCTLFDLVNNLFQLTIESDNLNLSLKRIFEERKILEDAKSSGFILGLERLWYETVDIAYTKDPEAAVKSWFDSGVWFAAHYTISNSGSFSFEQFKTDIAAFIWNAPEFDLESVGNKVSVKVTSPRFTEAYTFLFAAFLDGALDNLGYRPVSRDVSRGIIRLNATKKKAVKQ